MQRIHTAQHGTALPRALDVALPSRLSEAVRALGIPFPEELRLHADRYATVRSENRTYRTSVKLTEGELAQILKQMCAGSLYAYAETIARGYLTLAGGIRVGVCGSAATEKGHVIGVSSITGLTVRIPHAVEVDTQPLKAILSSLPSAGILLYSPPGVGKTTLLRSLAKRISSAEFGLRTVVIDCRSELTGTLDGESLALDVLVGYPRDLGIEIAVRSLSAQVIVCDEIGSESDAQAILSATNCGVPMIATAHAREARELLLRPPLRRLHDARVFGSYIGLCRTNRTLSYRITDWQDAECEAARMTVGRQG